MKFNKCYIRFLCVLWKSVLDYSGKNVNIKFREIKENIMGGFFGVASKKDCVFDLFYGVDYHSHLGTRRGGMAVHGEEGFYRAIHNIQNSPFRTKFERDV